MLFTTLLANPHSAGVVEAGEPTYLADDVAKAKAEKYAKIISKTSINASGENYGQNQFFYDAAEGLLSSIILMIAEYLPPTKVDRSAAYAARYIAKNIVPWERLGMVSKLRAEP